MSSASLLTLAGVISKDPNHVEYADTVKYSMLSTAQEALATYLHPSYLRSIKKKKVHASIATPGTISAESDFLKRSHFELSDGTPVDFIELENKRMLENTIEGGNDEQPVYIQYYDSGIKFQLLRDTYPVTNAVQYYVMKPPTISASQEPLLIGFDHLMLMYFKHLYHLIEGQADLAQVALTDFMKTIDDLNSKLRS